MQILDLVQGSPEWQAARAEYFTASEAPAMAGVSKHMTRADLLKQKYTGVAEDVTPAQQRLFDRGHAAEATARPIAEETIGEELYPVTGVSEEHPHLLASLDGCTMLEDVIFEHKLWNTELAAAVQANDLPEHYKVQMDQQLLVSGAERCLFMCSDGTRENAAWCWYEADQSRFDALLAAWAQFRADLEAYQPTDEAVKPEGKAPDSLPVLSISIAGGVQASNLPDFRSAALALIDGIKTELATDQDFSDAESATKWLQKGEKQLKASKDAALQQTADISALFETIDELAETMRQKRLTLEKLVKAEKTNRRIEIQQKASQAFDVFLANLNCPIEPSYSLNIAGAMKGKKTIATLQAAAEDEVARAKVECHLLAQQINSNKALLENEQGEYGFLFADWQGLIDKTPEDLVATIKARIAEHKEAEQKRQDTERERIRREEEAKAKADADARVASQAAGPSHNELGDRQPIDTSRPHSAAETLQRGSQISRPAEVTITRKEYDQLIADQSRLYALLNAGVDNWPGFDEAMKAA